MFDHRTYNIERYHKLRKEYITLLGGVCVKCRSSENLQFDHIDKNSKSFDVSNKITYPRDIVLAELEKCQLLCEECHKTKSLRDLDKKAAKGTHGTLSSYRYCRCFECKEAKRIYTTEYRLKKKAL
jgi:5-methylcytosine-specific restriction endonuclease McrA